MGANAGTAVPVYASGEVLTAARLNLTNCGVPVFSGTATRDAAFGGSGEKVLAEGQLCYLEDANVVQYYDSSSWLTVGPQTLSSGLNYITGAAFTTAAAVNVNDCFTSAYRNYKIIVQGTGSSTSAVAVNFRFRVGGADNSTNNYFYAYNTVDASNTETNVGAGSQQQFIIAFAGTLGTGFDVTVTAPQLAENKTVNSLFSSAGTLFGLTGRSGGTFNTTTVFDGFSLIAASGTITGTYRVYGLADS